MQSWLSYEQLGVLLGPGLPEQPGVLACSKLHDLAESWLSIQTKLSNWTQQACVRWRTSTTNRSSSARKPPGAGMGALCRRRQNGGAKGTIDCPTCKCLTPEAGTRLLSSGVGHSRHVESLTAPRSSAACAVVLGSQSSSFSRRDSHDSMHERQSFCSSAPIPFLSSTASHPPRQLAGERDAAAGAQFSWAAPHLWTIKLGDLMFPDVSYLPRAGRSSRRPQHAIDGPSHFMYASSAYSLKPFMTAFSPPSNAMAGYITEGTKRARSKGTNTPATSCEGFRVERN